MTRRLSTLLLAVPLVLLVTANTCVGLDEPAYETVAVHGTVQGATPDAKVAALPFGLGEAGDSANEPWVLASAEDGTYALDLPVPAHTYEVMPGLDVASYVLVAWDDLDQDGVIDDAEPLLGVHPRPAVWVTAPMPDFWMEAGAEPGWNMVELPTSGDPTAPILAVPLDPTMDIGIAPLVVGFG